jgi:hypothetical protein
MNDPEGYKVTSNHQSSNLILGTMTTYCNIKREGIQRSREEILRYLTYVRSPSASSLLLVSLQRNTPPSVHHKKKDRQEENCPCEGTAEGVYQLC